MSNITYRITIEKVERTEYEDVKEKYFRASDGSWLEWHEWYNLPQKEKDQYEPRAIGTGKMSTQERTTKLYEQEREELNIGDIAVYINRVR